MRHSKALLAITVAFVFPAALITSCSKNPADPSQNSSMVNSFKATPTMPPTAQGMPPGYEPAYVNGTTVTINAIEVKQNPTDQAQADFYEVVYPFDPVTGDELTDYWPSPPQCNPCDHQGNGITPDDFHDHVLDSQPSNPGHGAYNALWHVYLIMPNYTASATHNMAVDAMLMSMLPVKSEDAVNELTSTMVDGVPIANKIDTQFYFICDVVSSNAASH
jgi:hypothetical protein